MKRSQKMEQLAVLDIMDILEGLIHKFPSIAKTLIQEHQDLSVPKNQSFLERFDDVREHEYNWHQWGIFTHTKNFLECFQKEVPFLLKSWHLQSFVDEELQQSIDSRVKKELLLIAILFHDLGKFTNRIIKENGDFSFKHHEDSSGRIIREPAFSHMLQDEFLLTPAQVEYNARCAELHFKLGNLRTEAKKTNLGYSLAFVQSEDFDKRIYSLLDSEFDYAVEIGVLFLADSLSKMEFRFNADSDEEILAHKESVRMICQEKGFADSFVSAILQLPVSLAVTKRYLEILKSKKS